MKSLRGTWWGEVGVHLALIGTIYGFSAFRARGLEIDYPALLLICVLTSYLLVWIAVKSYILIDRSHRWGLVGLAVFLAYICFAWASDTTLGEAYDAPTLLYVIAGYALHAYWVPPKGANEEAVAGTQLVAP